MAAIIPFVETLDVLIDFVQSKGIYIQDFVACLKACKLELLKLYTDSALSFKTNNHHVFTSLTQLSQYDIHLKWNTSYNNEGETRSERLIFIVKDKLEPTKHKGQFINQI